MRSPLVIPAFEHNRISYLRHIQNESNADFIDVYHRSPQNHTSINLPIYTKSGGAQAEISTGTDGPQPQISAESDGDRPQISEISDNVSLTFSKISHADGLSVSTRCARCWPQVSPSSDGDCYQMFAKFDADFRPIGATSTVDLHHHPRSPKCPTPISSTLDSDRHPMSAAFNPDRPSISNKSQHFFTFYYSAVHCSLSL